MAVEPQFLKVFKDYNLSIKPWYLFLFFQELV